MSIVQTFNLASGLSESEIRTLRQAIEINQRIFILLEGIWSSGRIGLMAGSRYVDEVPEEISRQAPFWKSGGNNQLQPKCIQPKDKVMEQKKRIYCIEGVHDWGEGKIEPTVEPMLELLQRTGYWTDYLHRSCATTAELKYRLSEEWNNCCEEGSVLYFSTHGAPDQIWLREDDEGVGLSTLKEWLDLTGCHVHFGGCRTFSKEASNLKDLNLRDLMDYTGASSVSGYAADSDWLAWKAPAVALELLFFGLLSEVNLADGRGRAKRLSNIEAQLNERFDDCEFRMLTR